jgi:hypothetical protein
MKARIASLIAAATLLAFAGVASGDDLASPKSFGKIRDKRERSVALFVEAGKVIQHPRCINCHPAGERPTQTDAMRPHEPLVVRGANDRGAPGLPCTTCHHAMNFDPAGVPGNPEWHVAPLSQAWQGKSLGQICEQIKDPARNGGKSLEQIHTHMASDGLVGWGWMPGAGRTPVPGTQAQFGALIRAWIDTGAQCPAATPAS